ncbi:MAG: DUF3099 domain-containing protein [Sporichthyaceae bacterium]|nr:DUF3099 domain-containing protein [Sporichthyaceae bacterium]
MSRKQSGQSVYPITGARRGLTADVAHRQTRYVISMGIRTVCFVLAVIVPGPLRWVFLAGAFLLPYLSVVYANAGREQPPEAPAPIPGTRPELPPGAATIEGATSRTVHDRPGE